MSAPADLPNAVRRALDLSRRRGFVTSSRLETGRLLAVLAATRDGRLGECGAGCGVGAAWLSAAARPGSTVVTAELDPELAAAVAELFRDDARVEVLTGDWSALADHGPYSLLFLDVPEAKGPESDEVADQVADLLEPGGVAVIADFTPSSCWPPLTEGQVDQVRESWLTDPRFTTVDVMVTEDSSVLVAARR